MLTEERSHCSLVINHGNLRSCSSTKMPSVMSRPSRAGFGRDRAKHHGFWQPGELPNVLQSWCDCTGTECGLSRFVL